MSSRRYRPSDRQTRCTSRRLRSGRSRDMPCRPHHSSAPVPSSVETRRRRERTNVGGSVDLRADVVHEQVARRARGVGADGSETLADTVRERADVPDRSTIVQVGREVYRASASLKQKKGRRTHCGTNAQDLLEARRATLERTHAGDARSCTVREKTFVVQRSAGSWSAQLDRKSSSETHQLFTSVAVDRQPGMVGSTGRTSACI